MTGITNPAEAFFKDGQWTWDGSVWRKQPLLFGFSELAGEILAAGSLAAGTNVLAGAAGAAGEIAIVRQVAVRYVGTPPTSLQVLSVGTPGTPPVLAEYSVVSNTWYCARCFLVLEEGDYLTAVTAGATAGDALYFRYSGYKMSIVE